MSPIQTVFLGVRQRSWFPLAVCSALLVGCGGGSSGSDTPSVTPPSSPAAPPAQTLTLQDSLPVANATAADPELRDLTLSHLGLPDLELQLSGPCEATALVRRDLEDLSTLAFPQLLDHKLRCTGLDANARVEIALEGAIGNGDTYTAELTFDTGTSSVVRLTELDAVATPRATVDSLFENYLSNALLPELNLVAVTEALIAGALQTLLDDAWDELTDPLALYGARSSRLSYASRDPEGNAADRLTGLVAAPDTSGAFTAREQVIVLAHSTGSTPGDLDPTNVWYVLANVLAARGYLVVAADNWGRGDTADAAETYLMANRTAANSADFLQAVLADPQFAEFIPASGVSEVTIVGYSQGGHSAMALWQLLATQGPESIRVGDVFAGGAPHNLYRTFQGVLEQVDGRCTGGEFCRYADEDTAVGFVTDRIVPGFLDYTDTGLVIDEVVAGEQLVPTFVTGFLDQAPAYDALKILLQQSSFTNIANPLAVFGSGTGRLFLYHASRDRLVPLRNSLELQTLLESAGNVEMLGDVCENSAFETIFNLTDTVGIVHTLCGIAMIDDVLRRLR